MAIATDVIPEGTIQVLDHGFVRLDASMAGELAVVRFHIRCPIFVAREWMRHRWSSFNEFSMRYAKATDDFYVPAAEDVRTQVGKPGAYTFEQVSPELAEQTREKLQAVY